MEALLKTSGLGKTYGGVKVLSDVSFDLYNGEVHAVVGENGAGKSTFIKIIAGVERPDEGGVIYFEGTPVPHMSVHKSRNLGISVIFQDISLFPNLSVAENICFGGKRRGIQNWTDVHARAKHVLDGIGADIDLHAELKEISVGKQQLVAIARAVAFESKVIIMDEPTASLSSNEVEMLYSIIKKLKADGVGVIYISHKFEEIFSVADRVSVFRDGNLIRTGRIDEFDQQSLINLMVGRELHFLPFHMEGEAGEVLFSVKGLTCEPYFRNISFDVRKNEVLGITGLMGAGRSETAQAIFGLLPLDSGVIELYGKPLRIKNAAQAIGMGICYLPEDRRAQGLFMKKDMTANVTVTNLKKVLNKLKLLSFQKERDTALEFIESLSIKPPLPNICVTNMSGGNQQKVLSARWLNAGPKVLIVDEVTSGVDVGVKTEIHKLLRDLASRGVAIIMISSDLPEILAVADRIMVMRKGETVKFTAVADATQEALIGHSILG